MSADSDKIALSEEIIKLQDAREAPVLLWIIAVRIMIDNASGEV
jgi:hypothetical protein